MRKYINLKVEGESESLGLFQEEFENLDPELTDEQLVDKVKEIYESWNNTVDPEDERTLVSIKKVIWESSPEIELEF